MKTVVSLLCIFFCVILLATPVMALDTAASQSIFPDLLGDDFENEDKFGDDFDVDNVLTINDPLEPMNRVFFEFNDVMYEWVLSPLTDGYIWAVPLELRECFGNFFFNLASPVRFVNSLLQGELKQSGVVLSRFLINSTIGVYGLVDTAYLEFDMEPKKADFGQTLGRWGLGDGIYLCWPVIGPSSIRDSVGLVVDAYTHPIPYFHDNVVLDISYYTSNKLNTLSLNPTLYDDLKRFSLDPYVASRQAYYDYRKALVEHRYR
ncbi:MAG: phospholipid-binding lipoprotein MlaA [Desulforhopalus sp.]|jgi:phospholipid-binding lipoprotein MlaA